MQLHDWAGLELRHLIALQAVAEERSFGRAAERLGYTQSAVSHQIAALEGLVGERVIERGRGQRSVQLTQAGALLARHADAIVARLRAAQADYAAFAEGAAGVLRVGIYQSVGMRILPTLLREFGVSWPRVEVRLTESTSDGDLLSLIERGELDLTFTVFPLQQGPFEAVELLRDPYLLVVSANSTLSRMHQPFNFFFLVNGPPPGPPLFPTGALFE